MGGGRGEEFQATTTQGNLEENVEPNLDQVIDNIQVKIVEHVLFITKFKQLVIVVVEAS